MPYWLVYSLVTGSLGRSMAGDVDRAMLLAGRALDAATGSGCPTSLAWAHFGMGVALEQRDPHRAEQLLDDSVRMARTVESRLVLGLSLSLLAVLRRRFGRPLDAVPPLLELLDQWDRLGNRPQVWHAVREAAMCLADLGVDELAVTLLASVDRADLVMPLLPADHAHLSSLLSKLEETTRRRSVPAGAERGPHSPPSGSFGAGPPCPRRGRPRRAPRAGSMRPEKRLRGGCAAVARGRRVLALTLSEC